MKTWKLKNVEDEAKKYPDSFFIPSLEERKNIKINEVIKNLKSNFDDWTKYEISINYNEEGYIYQFVIE